MKTNQRITKAKLVYFIVVPLLMLATPAGAANLLFSEGFEYTDSPTNHGWTSAGSGGFVTSTDVAFEGARSVLLGSAAVLSHSLNEVSAASVDRISIYYYDSMLSGNNWDVDIRVRFDNASYNVGLGWYNPANYVIWESVIGSGIPTIVPRSQGWHRFEWVIHNGQLDLMIDGTVVASNFTTVSTVSSIELAVGTEPPLFAYVDKVEVFTSLIPVAIDIKPGSFPNSVNPDSKGKIPVAILTTSTTQGEPLNFDATTVDSTTVLFGATGTEAAPVQSALEDVDGDGDTDLILHFNTQDTGIVCGDTSASLTGETFGGQAIEGSDSIRTVGCK